MTTCSGNVVRLGGPFLEGGGGGDVTHEKSQIIWWTIRAGRDKRNEQRSNDLVITGPQHMRRPPPSREADLAGRFADL